MSFPLCLTHFLYGPYTQKCHSFPHHLYDHWAHHSHPHSHGSSCDDGIVCSCYGSYPRWNWRPDVSRRKKGIWRFVTTIKAWHLPRLGPQEAWIWSLNVAYTTHILKTKMQLWFWLCELIKHMTPLTPFLICGAHSNHNHIFLSWGTSNESGISLKDKSGIHPEIYCFQWPYLPSVSSYTASVWFFSCLILSLAFISN